jgi:protein CpxP
MTQTMKRIGFGVGAAVIALGLAAGVYATAQNTNDPPRPFMGRHGGPGPMGPMGGPGALLGRLPMLASQLGLSDTQKDQIKTILQSHREDWKGLGERAAKARQDLMAAVTANQFDETLIRDKAAAMSQVEADMAVAGARVFGEVFQVLTPDQQTKLRTMQSQMQQRAQSMRQRK